MSSFPETLEDLDQMVEEVERKGFRIRFLDPFADDPTEYKYLPAEDKDGVREPEHPDLLRKAATVAKIRKWTDLTVVGPDLEPVNQFVPSAIAHVVGGQVNNADLTPEQILATARINVPKDELPRSPYSVFDNEDKFDRLTEKVAAATGVSLSKLRRYAISDDVDGVENLEAALVQIAESIKAGS